MVGESGGVRAGLLDGRVGLVIGQPVQDIGRVTATDVCWKGAHWSETCVEHPSGFGTVFGVHVHCGFGLAAGTEALPVRR